MGRRGEQGGKLQGRRGATARASALALTLALLALVSQATGATALGVPAVPIPQNPSDLETAPDFVGTAAEPARVSAPAVPQNPFMAPNGRSNLHDDVYMTNTYSWPAPLGSNMQTLSTLQ